MGVFFAVLMLLQGASSVTGQQRVITFSDIDWTVRSSREPTAPGGNVFSDSPRDVWVDGNGALHLTLGSDATEVRARRPMGYGIYEARITARLDRLDPHSVFAFFTFELPSSHPSNREIDIEFSRWGETQAPNMQYSLQPSEDEENFRRFLLQQNGTATTHRIVWTEGNVEFLSWHGHDPWPPADHLVAARFFVSGGVVPAPGRGRIYFNFWRYQGVPLPAGIREEVRIDEFRFIPWEGAKARH